MGGGYGNPPPLKPAARHSAYGGQCRAGAPHARRGVNKRAEQSNLLVFGGSAARSLLTTIARAWATILGVVFSITMIVLQMASNAFTSEVVSRIKRATITQATLGCFVGLVTYALLLLKVVRESTTPGEAFVPVIGVNAVIIWSVTSIILVVLFLGFLSNQMQPGTLIPEIANDGSGALRRLSSSLRNLHAVDLNSGEREKRNHDHVCHVIAHADGYVQFVDWSLLARAIQHLLASRETEVTVVVQRTIGDEVTRGEPLARVTVSSETAAVGTRVSKWVQAAYVISGQRGADRDPAYAVQQLTAIGN